MAEASVLPTQPVFSPGLLLTHDWQKTQTERHFLETVIQKVESSSEENYGTVTFPITSACQYQAFVNGSGRSDVKGATCPIHLISKHMCETCSDRPFSAIVRMIYQVTRIESVCEPKSFFSRCRNSIAKRTGKRCIQRENVERGWRLSTPVWFAWSLQSPETRKIFLLDRAS